MGGKNRQWCHIPPGNMSSGFVGYGTGGGSLRINIHQARGDQERMALNHMGKIRCPVPKDNDSGGGDE